MKRNSRDIQTILIVEDDPATGEVMTIAIAQETRYHSILATTGKEALQAIAQEKPCLIILDYRLPDMSGLQLYDQIYNRKEMVDITTIFVSASNYRDEIGRRNSIFLEKPFDLDQFIRTIEEFIAPLTVCL